MAGIFGLLNKNKEYDFENVLSVLKKHALLDFQYSSHGYIHNNGDAGIGCAAPFLSENWPVKSKKDQYVFQLFGEIYLPDGSLLTPGKFELFLELFLKDKHGLMRKIDGAYVFCLYDTINKRFYICNDPFGNFSIYYFNSPDIFIFSTQIHGIYNSIKERYWDEQGFNEYLGLGFSLNGNTYYRGIKKLQAGEQLVCNQKKLKLEKYINFPYREDKVHLNENIDILKNSFLESIGKRFRNYRTVGAAITGGFDSRVTWGIINYLGCKDKAVAFTHGIKNARDVQIAKRITAKLNINHKIKIFDEDFIKQLPMQWDLFIRLTEGLSNVIGAHAIPSWQFLQNEVDVLLDSHGGVLFRRQFMKVAERRIKEDKPFEKQLFSYIKSPLLALDILKEDYRKSVIDYSVKALEKYFLTTQNTSTLADKIDTFYLNQISGNRYSSASNAQMNWIMLAHPFLNVESFNALSRIPVSKRKNQSIYKYIVSKTTPEFKKFFLENMGMPAPYFGFTYLRYIPMIYELFLTKSVSKLNYDLYKSMSLRRFVTDYDLFFKLNYNEMREVLLRNNTAFFEMINKNSLETLIKNADKSSKLSMLSSALTLKLFFDVFHKDS